MKIGSCYSKAECEFILWSPAAQNIELKIVYPQLKSLPMIKDHRGYWRIKIPDLQPGTRYYYRINNQTDRPDPASHFQPEDVHGPSEVVDHSAFKWSDKNWKGLPLKDYIIYELHTGTFTTEGTFEAAAEKTGYLKELGITAVELMPVVQFSGARNWGYDGVYPYAPCAAYGGPEGLKKFIDNCHSKRIAVILDVVYNHLGPEGNYFGQFGHYFTDRYRTPWGSAVNYDGAYSDAVRNLFIENALFWFTEYHLDALRLDAVETIFDISSKHFLTELSEKAEELSRKLGRKLLLIAESDLNDVKVINPTEIGGYGIDAQWCDDFHHSVHSLLTGEKLGYYKDFGEVSHLKEAVKNKFVYSGKYSIYRKKKHGSDASKHSPVQFVVCIQNHDQVGNRVFGERLSMLVSFEALKIAAGIMLLSPYIPLLFMGEEYGEESPFLFFVSYSNAELSKAVSEGRKREFEGFEWTGEIPDPADESTFLKSKLNWNLINNKNHRIIFLYYKTLIKFRKKNLLTGGKINYDVVDTDSPDVFALKRREKKVNYFILFNFNHEAVTVQVPYPRGEWKKIFDSSDKKWNGPGASTPEKILGKKQNITIKKFSLSIYKQKVN